MADYNINKSDGTPVVISTGAIDNTFDIPLLGQDSINYGDDFAISQLRLLENFANSTAPSFGVDRTIGQLWYDTTVGQGLKIWDGGTWDLLPLDTDVVHLTGAESIAGVKTFSSSAAFTAAAVPFTVNSTTVVANLNAALFDGQLPAEFASAPQGVLADNAEPDLLLPATTGFILSSTTGGTRSWIAPTTSTGDVDPDPSGGDTTTTVLLYPETTASGSLTPLVDGQLTYDAGINELVTTTFRGALAGNADTATSATTATTATVATNITVADESSDQTNNVVFVTAATGNLPPKTGSNLIFNALSGALTATSFVGEGTALTDLTAAEITVGILQVTQGGTGVILSTGSGSEFVLHNNPTLTNPTFVTRITTPVIRNGATGTTLEFNSGAAFRIVDETADDQCSGAEVVDGSGVFRPVGFNVIINTVQSGATISELNQARVGYSLRGTTSSGTKTYLVGTDTTIPDGATWIVKNLTTSTGVVIVTSDTGVTLRWMNGDGGTPPTDVGGASAFTLARGGVATVQKISDTEFDMWGVGIS